MGRISASHIAGLDLIDKLFFNQILVQCLFTEEHRWLEDLNTDLDRELTRRGIASVQRQIVRHGVLCMMEAELSDSLLLQRDVFPGKLPALPDNITVHQYEQVQRYQLNFFQAVVLAVLSKFHQCDKQMVFDITNGLLEKYKKAPATVRFRLVERMFVFDFESAPIDCYTWLSKMGVLNSVKHPGVALEARYNPEFLQRIALLCELDMLRDYTRRAMGENTFIDVQQVEKIRNISQKTIMVLLDNISKVMEVNSLSNLKNSFPVVRLTELEDPASIEHFFSNLNSYAVRFRIFQGSLASWVGMLCGGYVEVLHRLQYKKTSIYAGEFNEGTLTQCISDGMSGRGFEITTRAIYDRHRDFKETILRIVTEYYRKKLFENFATPTHMNDLTYEEMAPHFELFRPKPRRNVQRN